MFGENMQTGSDLLRRPLQPRWTPPLTGPYLEEAVVVEAREVEGEALAQHPVHPALQDGRHAEPVQRELREGRQGALGSLPRSSAWRSGSLLPGPGRRVSATRRGGFSPFSEARGAAVTAGGAGRADSVLVAVTGGAASPVTVPDCLPLTERAGRCRPPATGPEGGCGKESARFPARG